MRVCLVYPPSENMITTNVPSVVDDVSGVYPPLGLLYVAGAIEESGLHDVTLIDAVAENLTYDELEERIAASNPDVVGIQVITFTVIDAYKTAKIVKKISKDIKVLAGGPHVNLYPEETLSLPEVDYLLLGEGESSVVKFLSELNDGDLTSVPGCVYTDDKGDVKCGPKNELIEDLDDIPFPSRHLLDTTLYSSVLGKGKYLTTIMSSRGCPAKCIFCDRPHLGKMFRYRSAANVAEEMKACYERYGIDEYFFYDDTFTINRERVFDFCRIIKEMGLDVSWDIRARVSTVDEEMLDALRDAGCVRIHFGIESGSEKILKVMRKGVNLDRARELFKYSRKIGMETLAYFMLGFPDEEQEDVEKTFAYALSIDCDYIHVAITTPFPGTELYRMGLDRGLYKSDHWREFAGNPDPGFSPLFWEENYNRQELIDLSTKLYKSFYSRPSYIMRQALKVRSVAEFKKKASAGIKLLFR